MPFAFMVMPFGRKPTQAEPGRGPAEVDFNALWDKAFYPMLEKLGYRPIRADQEMGSLIINQMLERLYFSDLVLVDLTAPNGNVYYEMGVRHAAQQQGCVLLAADWSKPLFDVAQMRTVRYPLPCGEITDEQAQIVCSSIAPRIAQMRLATSPVFDILPGYPSAVDVLRANGIRDQVESIATYQAAFRAARIAPPSQRLRHFERLHALYLGGAPIPGIGLGLLRLLVDSMSGQPDWQRVLDYIGTLDPLVASETYVHEQQALALGKLGRSEEAIEVLEALITIAGATPEREGLIGGRCKELWRVAYEAGSKADARHWLDRTIDHYERGMMLDLNEFFSSSNLPRLYRERNAFGDEERVQTALHVTIAACQRSQKRGTGDEWVRPTLLGVQFDIPDADEAENMLSLVQQEGAAAWKLDSTQKSLRESLRHVKDETIHNRLESVLTKLACVN